VSGNHASRHRPKAFFSASLEMFLGDPRDERSIHSHLRTLDLDKQELFPEEASAKLDLWGLPHYYVPAEYGGRLDDYEQLFALVRAVARRDLSLTISHAATFLGAVGVWVGGSERQCQELAKRILQGSRVALALTERAHGSDLVASDLEASVSAGAYVLRGEKWLINNATRSDLLSVLARTDSSRNPRSLSLLLVDKAEISPSTYRLLPKVRTHGIRGIDVSGIAFSGTCVSKENCIGQEGHGFEIILKGLQITRTACSALSLGAADTLLEMLLHKIEINGSSKLLEYHLANAIADIFAAEAVSLVGARAIHFLTEELGLISAITKVFVPSTVDNLLESVLPAFGVDSLLLDGNDSGLLQKLHRDHRIVGLFDGSTVVNLQVIALQLRGLVRSRQQSNSQKALVACRELLGGCSPERLNRERLALLSRPKDTILASLEAARNELSKNQQAFGMDDPSISSLVDAILARLEQAEKEIEKISWSGSNIPPFLFDLAYFYTLLYASVCCLNLWLANEEEEPSFAPEWRRNGLWLRLALIRLLERMGAETKRERSLEKSCLAAAESTISSIGFVSLTRHRNVVSRR